MRCKAEPIRMVGCSKWEAEKMQRRLEGRLKHVAAQVEMVQRQLAAYIDVDADDAPTSTVGADADRHTAQVALARAESIVEMLEEPDNRMGRANSSASSLP